MWEIKAVDKRKIGAFDVNPVGLGCMNVSHAYGPAIDRGDALALIHGALDLGYDLIDTATIYGAGENEKLVGEAIRARRDEVTLCSKCVLSVEDGKRVIDARPAAIKRFCEASLARLNTGVIDLYYLHRLDPDVPIEDSMGAMADLVREGKIKAIGLSEMSAPSLRRAQAVHPVAAMQSEYSLWTRNPEIAVLDACDELGVAFVTFSPLGRGFLADAPVAPDAFKPGDLRRNMPRFNAENYPANLALLDAIRPLAARLGAPISQIAIAWTLAKAAHVICLPGTTKPAHIESNFSAADLMLDARVIAELEAVFTPHAIAGPRYAPALQADIDTEEFAAPI